MVAIFLKCFLQAAVATAVAVLLGFLFDVSMSFADLAGSTAVYYVLIVLAELVCSRKTANYSHDTDITG